MAREDFLVNLRNAAYFLEMTAQPVSGRFHHNRLTKALSHIPSWLKPASMAGFEAADFPELSVSERRQLMHEVAEFRAIAQAASKVVIVGAVSSSGAKGLHVGEGFDHLQQIVTMTGKAVRAEWMEALERFIQDAENWARERDWGVKRDIKRLEDGMLGTYDVPRLLIHTLENRRYFLDPQGREIYTAIGRVDLCMIPSEDSIGIIRTEKGWFVLPDNGSARSRPWTRDVFYRTLDQLAKAA